IFRHAVHEGRPNDSYSPNAGHDDVREETVVTGVHRTEVASIWSPLTEAFFGVRLGSTVERPQYGTRTTIRQFRPGFYKNKALNTWHPWGPEHIYTDMQTDR